MLNIYKYPNSRWFMLGLFMLLTIMVEMQWLSHAPIARVAEKYYGNQLQVYSCLSVDSILQ